MRKLSLLLAAVLAVPILVAGPAGAQTGPVSGRVQMTVHTHSAGTLLFPIDRLAYSLQPGETFSYSSRLCSGNAPFNDLGLNFIPDYPGVDSATGVARVRHRFQGVITSSSGGRGSLQGKLTTVLCVPGASPNGYVESGHVIVSNVWASFQRISDNDLQINGGFQFSPTESTGTFKDLQGGGQLQGRFTCLGGNPTCAQRGEYTDFVGASGNFSLPPGQLQPGLSGTYYDPTVLPVS